MYSKPARLRSHGVKTAWAHYGSHVRGLAHVLTPCIKNILNRTAAGLHRNNHHTTMTGGTDAFLLLRPGSSEQGETQQRHVGADDNRMHVANMIASSGLDYTNPPPCWLAGLFVAPALLPQCISLQCGVVIQMICYLRCVLSSSPVHIHLARTPPIKQ